ncbi:GNAT family N-acetyltransferase [Streptomyces sp. NPDC050418]|uniref:GNAT family N-acetyltransferase n=1 Tax=Streptomyces sp. NPDC050418 TaxID=3365612 RepID=UPI0037B34451
MHDEAATPTSPTIRPARPTDLTALQALARRTIDTCYRSFLGDEAVDWFIGSGASDEHVRAALEKGGVHCLVEAESGEIVGFSIVDGATVDLMMVDPAHQRRGLGRQLLSHAQGLLLAEYRTIRLETFTTNTRAVAFYEACGWEQGELLAEEGPAKVEYVKHR